MSQNNDQSHRTVTGPPIRVQAAALANRVLDRVSADPDDDLAVLARQLLHEIDMRTQVTALLRSILAHDERGQGVLYSEAMNAAAQFVRDHNV